MEEKTMLTNSAVRTAEDNLKAIEATTVENTVADTAKAVADTGMIMDANELQVSETSKEQMEAAITNNRIAQLMQMRKVKQQVRQYGKIQRNDPCPCGSGKKYKNCCLATGEYEKRVDIDQYEG